jgi:hypothetical protein
MPTLELPWSEIHIYLPRGAYPGATLERNTYIFTARRLPWSYPRLKRPRIRRAPTLELPWSATLERDSHIIVRRLPCTYPGAPPG